MRRTHGWVALGVIAGMAFASPASAQQSNGIVVDGLHFASWSEFYRSDYFRENGKRCGTPSPVRLEGAKGGASPEASPSDCSMTLTNPSAEYEPDQTWEIQVVVHYIKDPITGMGELPDSLAQTQIDVLNEDYLAIAGSPGAPGTNQRIRFKLATVDPDGHPATGITHTENTFWFNDLPDPINGDYWTALAWDPTRYLNIYTLSPEAPGGVVLGYVPYLPQEGAGGIDDGVRCLWGAFGRPGVGGPPYDQGRTVTHEVGHYLGLLHTFEGGCGTVTPPGCYTTSDLVCDTSPESASEGGCPEGASSCSGLPEPIHNYMDYTDDLCMNQFTPEQTRRVRCSTQFYRPNGYTVVQPVAVGPQSSGTARFALAQNQPNPFVFSTELSFVLPEAGPASLMVLDLSGRVIRTLAVGNLPAGQQRVRWDGTDDHGSRVSPGVYFYRLGTREGSRTRRMTFVQ